MEDLFSKEFDLGSIEIKVDFLDTSGSMQFPAMRRLSITTGSAFLIVYAVDDEKSYTMLKMCVDEIREIRADFQVSTSLEGLLCKQSGYCLFVLSRLNLDRSNS